MFTSRCAALCLLMAVCIFMPSELMADTDKTTAKKKKNSEDVETHAVMVTASRTEQFLNEIPMSVTLVDSEELKRKPNTDVASQLAEVPGVQIHGQTSVGGNRRVVIRGMGGSRTLILVDGVKQPELRGIDGSFFNVDPANIERIEVIKGPASVLYGSDAIGGVVNIITKKGQNEDKAVKFYTGFIADSSTGSIEPKVAISGTKDGFSYRLSGSGVEANDRSTPEGEIWHSSFSQRQYAGSLGYKWAKGSFDFSFDNYQGTSENIATTTINGLVVPTDPWRTPTIVTVGETPRNDRAGYTGRLVFEDLSDNLKKLTISGFFQELKRESDTVATFRHPTHTEGLKTAKTYNNHDSYGGSIQTDWLIGSKHFVTLGLDYDKSEFDSTGYRYSNMGAVTSTDLRGGYQETLAFFGQDEYSITDSLMATLGLRYTSVDTALTTYSGNPGMINNSTDDNLVGSLGLVYSGIDDFHFRALYSQGYRSGNLLQKFMGSGTTMLPNPGLQPETSDNYELGVRYDDGALNVDLALFYNKLKDGLSMVQVGPNVYQYINYGKIETSGIELAVEYLIEDFNLTPYGSISLLNYRTHNPTTGFTSNHNGRASVWGVAGLKWESNLNDSTLFFLDGNVHLSGGAHSESYNRTTGQIAGSNFRKGWQTANLTLGLEGTNDYFKYNSSISLRNIFDQHYTPIYASPMPEPGFNVVWSFGVEF